MKRALVLTTSAMDGKDLEKDETFAYHSGNDQEIGQVRGFGHFGFLVDDLEQACFGLEAQGYTLKKKPEGAIRG
jgi:hypothetical protein